MHSTDSSVRGQITGAPTISLVDLDGLAVPCYEVDAPIVPPPGDDDESDPSTWPAWTDDARWGSPRPPPPRRAGREAGPPWRDTGPPTCGPSGARDSRPWPGNSASPAAAAAGPSLN